MAAKKVKVTYQDGREEIVKVLPRAQVMTEEYFKGFKSENSLTAGFHLGWAALHVAGKESLDFETWLNKVEDVEDYTEPKAEDAEGEPAPTQPAPSGDVSSE
jgi:hypothetical protein